MSARIRIAVPAEEIRFLGELEQVIDELPDCAAHGKLHGESGENG